MMLRRRGAVPVLLATVLLGAACTSTGESGESGDAEPAAEAEGPATADRLTIALTEDKGPLNIFTGQTDQFAGLVYDKLLSPSPYVQEPTPWLATAVRQVDPSTWEVDLREGVSWHDGETFDAADVAFTFDYMKKAPTGRWTHHVSDIPTIDTVTALTPTSVRFTCAFPCPELGTVTLADLPIIPEHIWSAVPPEKAKEVTELPVGTGPYRLVSYDATTGYRFEASPDYFAGEPVVRELVMPVITDPSATFTALRSGEIDATVRRLSPELVEQFSASDELGVLTTAPLQFPELRINFRRAPFDQPRFRTALSRAVDRDQLLTTVGLGQGRPAVQGYPHPDAPFANPSLSTPYAPDEATSILDTMGFADTDGDGTREGPNGPLDFTIHANGGEPTDVRAAELVAENLREVAIGARVETLDAGSLADLSTSREYDFVIGSIGAHGVADPTQFIMSHRSGYLWDAPTLPYPEWDALFARWEATTTIEDRLGVLQEMQTLFNQQPTSIPLYYPDEYWAFRKDSFAGWVESPGYGIVHKWSLLPPQVAREAGAVVAGGPRTTSR
jgi:peptide/nickel transport system substrate-binding protein